MQPDLEEGQMTDWKTVAGVVLLLVAVIGFIVMMNLFDGMSRRERGLPRKEKKIKGKREKP